MIDAVETVLRILRANADASLFVLDFKDAFKQLKVAPDESRYLAGTAPLHGVEGYFVYTSLLFGAKSGPLLWGRLAALLMRITAAMLDPTKAGHQCYVDDPFGAHGGDVVSQDITLAAVILLWQVLGLEMSWDKGMRGDSVDWLGALIQIVRVNGRPFGVEVSISMEKAKQLLETSRHLLSHRRIARKELRRFAGLCSWMASIIPALRPFIQPI